MILTGRMAAVFVTMALATGGAAWGVHALLTPTGDAGTDYGLDTNGNGKFDFLVVEAQISIPQVGTWDVYADLSTSGPPTGGNCGYGVPVPLPMIEAQAAWSPITYVYERYFFTSGTQTVRMAFQGTDLARAGIDGPYAVHARLSIGPVFGGMGRPIIGPPPGGVEWNYTTKAYTVAEFEQPVRPAFFTGGHTDVAVDVDSDGLADFLEIRADIHVNLAGRYSLNGGLTKGSGRDVTQFIGYAYRDLVLSATDTSVWLRFRGDMIRRANVDGPWNFTLTLYGPIDIVAGNSTVPLANGSLMPRPFYFYPETLCGLTSAYRAADFDATSELARFTGHFQELTPDLSGDGTYDFLILRAEVEVFLSAGFDFVGTLRSANGAVEVAHGYSQSWLLEGKQTVDFAFPGPEIHAVGIDGPYVATLSITPTAGGIDPSTTYTTRAYRAADFDAGYTNGTRRDWISDLNATAQSHALAIEVRVVRGNDQLAIVIQDILTVTVTDPVGTVLNTFKESVSLPSGGYSQGFSYTVNYVRSGTYTIAAVLGSPDHPVDQRTVTVAG